MASASRASHGSRTHFTGLKWCLCSLHSFTSKSITYEDSHFSVPVKHINIILNIYSRMKKEKKKQQRQQRRRWWRKAEEATAAAMGTYICIRSQLVGYRRWKATYAMIIPLIHLESSDCAKKFPSQLLTGWHWRNFFCFKCFNLMFFATFRKQPVELFVLYTRFRNKYHENGTLFSQSALSFCTKSRNISHLIHFSWEKLLQYLFV